jgi:hypothetical protein
MKTLEDLKNKRTQILVSLQLLHFDLQCQLRDKKESVTAAIELYERKSEKFVRLLSLYTETIEKIENDLWLEKVRDEISEMVVQCGLC